MTRIPVTKVSLVHCIFFFFLSPFNIINKSFSFFLWRLTTNKTRTTETELPISTRYVARSLSTPKFTLDPEQVVGALVSPCTKLQPTAKTATNSLKIELEQPVACERRWGIFKKEKKRKEKRRRRRRGGSLSLSLTHTHTVSRAQQVKPLGSFLSSTSSLPHT